MAKKPQFDDEVYDIVVHHWMNFWQPPTMQYLVDNTGLSSKSSIRSSLFRLRERGLMRMIKGKAVPAGIEIKVKERV